MVKPRIDVEPVSPTVEIEVDLEAAEERAIKPGDVRRAAAILLSGVEVGSLFEEQKVFEVVVWGTPSIRQSLSDVEDLLIDRPQGGQVRLGDVASVKVPQRQRDRPGVRVSPGRCLRQCRGRGLSDARPIRACPDRRVSPSIIARSFWTRPHWAAPICSGCSTSPSPVSSWSSCSSR